MTRSQSLFRMAKIGHYPYFTKNSTELKYFVDYNGSNGFLVVLSADDFLFYTDTRYIEAYSNQIGSDKVRLIENMYSSPLSGIFRDFKELGMTKIFVDYNDLRYQEALDYQKNLKPMGIEMAQLPVDVRRIRMVKEPSEVEIIRKSQKINEKSFAAVIALLKEGVTEQDMAAEFEYIVKKQGASGTSFDSIIVFGENSSAPHGVPGNRKLKRGDVVLFDAGVLYENYCSDMTRTLCFGEPTDDSFKKNYNLLLQAQKDCLSIINSSTYYHELDAFVRKELEKSGLAQYFTHSLGHGVGIDIHEIPRIFHQNEGEPIHAGHVFTVEPGLYLAGQYGIRIEDMVHMKADHQAEILSEFPKELLIL